MRYFIVFNKKGIVQHEEGERPPFLNSLIRSINTRQATGSKTVRDDLMEYEIDGKSIFLSIANKPSLRKAIEDFKSRSNKGDGEERESVREEIKMATDALDFSTTVSTASSVIESIRKVSITRTFNLFSGKIRLDDLKPRMIEHLVQKNVDPSFCQIITSDVIDDLKEQNVEMVTEGVFKRKITGTLSKLLPRFDHDAFAEGIKKHTGVFSICFVGVNGVGKSTTLAKVACWLIQKGLRVYIAACDTFRAGAIEQLKVHVERFKLGGHDVGFFESGYAKDDSSVAKHAIARANKENYDVILIDTAGRMHNKENLMASLSKLIRTNNPDHIVFVGEAIAGGDTLDHIKEFNKRIGDSGNSRKIDGIILTKIDTVDNKIGQVLNFVFASSSPIMFLGTGQTNSDLSPMDPVVVADLIAS